MEISRHSLCVCLDGLLNTIKFLNHEKPNTLWLITHVCIFVQAIKVWIRFSLLVILGNKQSLCALVFVPLLDVHGFTNSLYSYIMVQLELAVCDAAPLLKNGKNVLVVSVYSHSDNSFPSEHICLLISGLELMDLDEEIIRGVIAVDACHWHLHLSSIG